MVTDSKFAKKKTTFNDLKDVVISDVVELWRKGSLPTIESKSIHKKLKMLHQRFEVARKSAKKRKHSIISEDWLKKLFDLSKCRCDIPDCFTTYKGKLFCYCKFDDRVPEKEISFLKDQRLSRKMILTSSKDVMFNKRKMQVFVKQSKPSDFIEEQPTCSKKVKITDTPGDAVLATLRRARKPSDGSIDSFTDHLSSSPMHESRESNLDDYHPPNQRITGGKSYKKLRKFTISTSDCKKADRRLISIRQQSELQRSTVGDKRISASPATVYRKREQCRIEALSKCVEELRNTKAIQLCYDGKIINKLDRYVMLAQYMDEAKSKGAAVIAVKTFAKNVSVTAEVVFSAIKGNVNGTVLNKVFSIMSDTTSLNTGKVSGVNKRLTDFYKKYHGRNIHSLECLFHVNEIYLSHIIAKRKGPGPFKREL